MPTTTTATSSPRPATATARTERRTERRADLLVAAESVVVWFLGTDEQARRRSWGIVPLVLASSSQGFGGGLRFVETDLLEAAIGLSVSASGTSNEFYRADIALNAPPLWLLPGTKWSVAAGYHSLARLPFHGIGNRRGKHDRASLWLERTYTELQIGHTFFADKLALFGVVRFENVNTRNGRPNDTLDLEPIEQRYDTSRLVGYGNAGLTNSVGVSVLLDNRDNDFDPRSGWRAELGARYHGPEIGDSPYRFGRYYADVAYYRTLVPERLVFAARGRIDLVDGARGRTPFYALPTLGGLQNLRGFLDGRWRDRHAVFFQGELRFPIWRMFSGAVFVDAGRVFDDVTEPPFLNEFHYDGGLGLRLVIHPNILGRFDLGISDELVTFGFTFGQSF